MEQMSTAARGQGLAVLVLAVLAVAVVGHVIVAIWSGPASGAGYAGTVVAVSRLMARLTTTGHLGDDDRPLPE